MATRSIATGPDVLMFIGLVPMALWVALMLVQVLTVGSRSFDLTMLMLGGISGVFAYLIVCFVAGGSALWAIRRAKTEVVPPTRLTKILSTTTACVMVAPWALVALQIMTKWVA